MVETDTDPELHELVIEKLTRIGIIMEDASPVALDSMTRVLIVADASDKTAVLTWAVKALIGK